MKKEKWTFIDDIKFEVRYQYNSVMSFFRSISTGIKNFWYWRKVIWHNRWWDYSFFVTIIETQLQYMHDYWDKSMNVNSEEDKAEIKEVLDLIHEIQDLEVNWETPEDEKRIDPMYEELGKKIFSVTEKHHTYEEFKDGETKEISYTTKTANLRRWWD